MSDTPDKQPEPDPVLEQGASRLQQAGLAVFVAAAGCALFFLSVTSFFPWPIEDWVRLRTIELFSMLASIGVVVALISRTQNRFVTVFGILLIGALIVPTKDMVSLALLASGKDPVEEGIRPNAADGSEYRTRYSDLASKIVTQLQIAPRNPEDVRGYKIIDQLVPEERRQAEAAVTEALARDLRTTQMERARFNGSLTLLLAFDDATNGGYKEYFYRHSGSEAFLQDLRDLRGQELVRFSYDDFAGAQITRLGKEVVCEYFRVLEKENICTRYPEITVQENQRRDQLGEEPLVSAEDGAVRLCRDSAPSDRLGTEPYDRVVLAPHVLRLAGSAQIVARLEQTESGFSDPYLVLLDAGTCGVIAANDDADGNTLNAGLEIGLAAPDHLLVATTLTAGGGESMRLHVTRTPPVQ